MIYWKWSTVPVADLVQPLVQKKTLPQALDWSWQQPAAPGWASPLDPTKFGLKHKEIFQRRVFWICTSSLSSNWGEEGLCPWTSIFLVDGTFLIWRPKKLVPLWLLRQLSLSKIKVENRDGNSPTGKCLFWKGCNRTIRRKFWSTPCDRFQYSVFDGSVFGKATDQAILMEKIFFIHHFLIAFAGMGLVASACLTNYFSPKTLSTVTICTEWVPLSNSTGTPKQLTGWQYL
jgi:hypothetical protein